MSNDQHPNRPPSTPDTSPIANDGALAMIQMKAKKDIHNLTQGNAIDQNECQGDVIEMATAMSQLSYQDYLTLDGILKDLLKGSHPHDFATLAKQDPNDTLKTIYLALDTLSEKPDYATDATLLLRRCYPFGTNIVNKYWDESKGPFGFDASEPGVIWATSSTDIKFSRGKEDEATCIIEAEGKTVVLREGEPFIIGRPLMNQNPFKTKIDASILPQLPINNDNMFSRAGILLILQNGILYIFDKGSRNTITAYQSKLGISVTYNTLQAPDGSYGFSQVDQSH